MMEPFDWYMHVSLPGRHEWKKSYYSNPDRYACRAAALFGPPLLLSSVWHFPFDPYLHCICVQWGLGLFRTFLDYKRKSNPIEESGLSRAKLFVNEFARNQVPYSVLLFGVFFPAGVKLLFAPLVFHYATLAHAHFESNTKEEFINFLSHFMVCYCIFFWFVRVFHRDQFPEEYSGKALAERQKKIADRPARTDE